MVRDFELNELHLQCKKTPLTKHRDRKDAASAATSISATAADAEPAAETSDDLPDEVDSDEKKTQ